MPGEELDGSRRGGGEPEDADERVGGDDGDYLEGVEVLSRG